MWAHAVMLLEMAYSLGEFNRSDQIHVLAASGRPHEGVCMCVHRAPLSFGLKAALPRHIFGLYWPRQPRPQDLGTLLVVVRMSSGEA